MEKKKFVEIQSDITIKVTAGLQYSDYTDKTLALPNKLNVKPRWVDTSILIRQGKHVYPSEVVGWQTVKALEAKNILTIGKFVDDADEDVKQEATLAVLEQLTSHLLRHLILDAASLFMQGTSLLNNSHK